MTLFPSLHEKVLWNYVFRSLLYYCPSWFILKINCQGPSSRELDKSQNSERLNSERLLVYTSPDSHWLIWSHLIWKFCGFSLLSLCYLIGHLKWKDVHPSRQRRERSAWFCSFNLQVGNEAELLHQAGLNQDFSWNMHRSWHVFLMHLFYSDPNSLTFNSFLQEEP